MSEYHNDLNVPEDARQSHGSLVLLKKGTGGAQYMIWETYQNLDILGFLSDQGSCFRFQVTAKGLGIHTPCPTSDDVFPQPLW